MYAAHKVNKVIVTGFCSVTNQTGYSLAGGYSHLSKKYGMSVDTILRIKIYLYSKKKSVWISNNSNNSNNSNDNNLFNMLCGGGGGNFGIVTAIEMKLYPEPGHSAFISSINITDPSSQKSRPLIYLHRDLSGVKPTEFINTLFPLWREWNHDTVNDNVTMDFNLSNDNNETPIDSNIQLPTISTDSNNIHRHIPRAWQIAPLHDLISPTFNHIKNDVFLEIKGVAVQLDTSSNSPTILQKNIENSPWFKYLSKHVKNFSTPKNMFEASFNTFYELASAVATINLNSPLWSVKQVLNPYQAWPDWSQDKNLGTVLEKNRLNWTSSVYLKQSDSSWNFKDSSNIFNKIINDVFDISSNTTYNIMFWGGTTSHDSVLSHDTSNAFIHGRKSSLSTLVLFYIGWGDTSKNEILSTYCLKKIRTTTMNLIDNSLNLLETYQGNKPPFWNLINDTDISNGQFNNDQNSLARRSMYTSPNSIYNDNIFINMNSAKKYADPSYIYKFPQGISS